MNPVVHTRAARADLDEIWDYIARDNLSAADEMIDRLVAQAQLIATQPRMGRSRFDLATELRSFPVGDYLLFYRPTDHQGIQVVRILHGRRDITAKLF